MCIEYTHYQLEPVDLLPSQLECVHSPLAWQTLRILLPFPNSHG